MGLEQTDGRGRGGLIDQSGIMLREGGAHLARLPCRRLKHFTAGGLEAAEKLPHLFAIPVRRTGSGGGRKKQGEQKQKSSFPRQVVRTRVVSGRRGPVCVDLGGRARSKTNKK